MLVQEGQGEGATAPSAAVEAAPVEVPAAEAPVLVEEEKPKEDIDFTERFTALTRREKRLIDREKALKAKEQDPAWKEYTDFVEIKKDPRRNALKILESHGLTYKDITDIVLSDGKVPVETEIELLKKQIEEDKKAREEGSKKASVEREQEIIDGHKQAIKAHIEESGDDYELITANNAHDTVFEIIEECYRRTGKIIPIKDAATQLEEHLLSEAKKLLSLKKLSPKQVEVPSSEEPPEDKILPVGQQTPAKPASKTLTNANMSTVSSVKDSDPNLMDPERRREWTAAKLKAMWANNK